MDKQKALDTIADEIAHCAMCQEKKSGKPVPGEGNPDAHIVFIGEAPGKQEAATGRPFIGRSGKLLRSFIRDIDLDETDVFITSVVKYLPDHGTPSKSDIAHGRTHTMQQLAIIQPQIVVLLGSIACQGIVGEVIPINQKHGEVIEKDGIQYIVMFHPSAALRFPPLKEKLVEDFEKLRALLKTQHL